MYFINQIRLDPDDPNHVPYSGITKVFEIINK